MVHNILRKMHLVKTFSVLRKCNVRGVVKYRHALQIPSVRCNSTAEETTLQEAGPIKSTVVEEIKIMKGPFIKNLFTGVFDLSVLEYPEYPSLAYIQEVDKLTAPIEEYFANCIQSSEIDKTKAIPQDVLMALKEHGLYALQAPKHLGGIEIDDKCFSKFFESIGSDISVSTALASHYRTLHALLLFGTEEQKERFLPRMLSGELKVGFGFTENSDLLNVIDVKTTALPVKDEHWKLNGKKIWIADGDKSDYFLVFAKTSLSSNVHHNTTAFLVDRNSPGVNCGSNIDQLGTRGVGLIDVVFDDVIVTKEHIVGDIGDGENVAMQALCRGRQTSSAATVGYLKEMLNALTDFVIHKQVDGKSLHTFEYYKYQLGMISADIYALESMVYLTAGLKDTYDEADLTVEDSLVRLFSIEKTIEISDLCANLGGGSAYISGSPLERRIRDARSHLIHDVVPTTVTKLFIATLGVHHAGTSFRDEIKKARNPLHFPAFAMKNLFKKRDGWSNDNIPGDLRLVVHPSLCCDADKLEKCVILMEHINKDLLQRYGVDIINRHMDLVRLADCAISMYAMTAVIARASRSYCIGLSNSNFDMVVSNIFCGLQSKKVEGLVDDMHDGPMETYETPSVNLGYEVSMLKGYFFEHPLARNY